MKTIIIAALFAATNAVRLQESRVHHPRMDNHAQFAEGMDDSEVDSTDFFNLLQTMSYTKGKLPTCDKFETTNCQPNCTETLTTGCTESRTPNAPTRDRYEGRRTFKGPEKPESPWGV